VDTDRFEIFALTPADAAHPGLAVAAAQASGIGVLDLEFCRDPELVRRNFLVLLDAAESRIGLRLTIGSLELARRLLAEAHGRELHLILAGAPEEQARLHQQLALGAPHPILAEITDAGALARLSFAYDGLIAKGHEAGGWVGAETSYILLQKLLTRTLRDERGARLSIPASLPVYARGGIGVNGAAACRALGAAGVVLDDPLLLLAESPLPQVLQNELARLNGSETRLFGELLDASCRVYARPAAPALKAAEEDHRRAEAGELPQTDWRARMEAAIAWSGQDSLLPIGQGIGLARAYRDRYHTVAGLIKALRKASVHNIETAARLDFLAPGGPLAAANGTRYPLAQGPMTRVSDNAEFAYQVAKHGALPFLALALMRGPQVRELLHATRAKMQAENLPWGVGQLGFVPQALREEQCAEIWNCKPTFALLAGGRPDQAAEYEKRGIPTYIHAPAPALLKMYLEQGARRFVFEGRECGGHIGPLASFPLWEQMIEVLLAEVPKGQEGDCHLLFAGGISDAASGAMLAALTAPLAARGFKVGALMGTAYLFTREIVESGAIVPHFQDQALRCTRTVNLESGPGHSTRCADTPFARDFYRERRKLLKENRPIEEIRERLEDLNLGRLRIASKGRDRNAEGRLVEVEPQRQQAEGMYMIGQAATLHETVRDLQTLHRDVTEGAMRRLREQAQARAARRAAAKPSQIAIVGIGTLLPKAGDAQRYWRNILDQVRVLREVPPERWDWKLYFDPDRNARDKVYSRWGGFLDEVPFDPIAYGIPPKSMKSIDPMQLLTLEVARRALVDAGMADGDFDREHTSIILGAGGGLGDLGTQYAVRAELPRFVAQPEPEVWERLPEWTEESFAGSLLNVAAGRVANRLDFGGVNFIVDAACASSLAAVAMAINELESGRSNVVLAGGVDTVQSAFGFMSFSKTQALSPDGQPKTFDQAADGIAISEGLAMVVLKRLADAERDGDRIYAVIKACAGSSDGKALGMTAPRPEGQKRALRRAYAQAGFSPATLGLIEAHGTGTPVGDRAEAQTITETLAAEGAAPHTCAVGSVKTLIGHTKASAGVCGLIKAALSLHYRTLPGHYGVNRPIETLADERSPVYLLKEPRPWLAHPDHPRRAGVSAFGFGGTNFHAVLEEYAGQRAAPGAREWPYELLCFQAANDKDLALELGRLISAIRQGGELNLRDLAYSLARAHQAHPAGGVSLALIARDRDGLLADLEAVLARLENRSDKPLPPSARLGRGEFRGAPVALLFPGQGAQYVNMGREAALYLDELRHALEFADRSLRADFPQGLSRFILPPAAFDEATEQKQTDALRDTRVAQPAIGALSLGYLRLAEKLGVVATAAAGHSYGEYTALAAAGVLAPKDFLRLSAVRGRCMADAARSSVPGAMAAVQARRELVVAAIAEFAGVRLANHNAPEQAVISGPAAEVEAAAKKLEAAGVRVTRLPVSGAFHTELVASAQLGLSAAIAAAPVAAPRFAVYSNASGRPYPTEPVEIRRVLDEHMLRPVEFVAEIDALYAAGCRVFVELGPKGVCTNLAKATLAGREFMAVALDGQGGGLRGVLLGLAELYAAGVELKLTRLFDGREPRLIELGRLTELVKPLPLPKHAWWVSGGGARPLNDPQFRTGKLPALDAEAVRAARTRTPQTSVVHSSTPAIAPAAPPELAAPAPPIPAAAALGNEALVAYQQTMRQFLQLQERVLMQFLGGAATPSAAAAPPSAMPAVVTAPIAAPHADPSAPPVPYPVPATAPAASAGPPRQAQEVVSAQAPAFDARRILLELVAERTGYPQEMLGLEQDLEAELGIDSIKRVEILGALRKRLPAPLAEAMQGQMERFTKARSLKAILEALTQLATTQAAAHAGIPAAQSGAAQATPEAGAPDPAAAAVPRYVPRQRPAPLPARRLDLRGLYLLTPDAGGVAEKLADRIVGTGAQAHVLPAAALEQPEQLAIEVARAGPALRGIVHLAGLDPDDSATLAAWKRQSQRHIKSLFRLMQFAAESLAAPGATLLAASRCGGSFGREAESAAGAATAGGALGLFNCALHEWPALRARLVDFAESASSDFIADALLDELQADDTAREIGYPCDAAGATPQRRGFVHQPEPLVDHPFAPHLRADGDWVVLITGGARGITAEIAEELVRRALRPGLRLVLVGRTTPAEREDSATVVLTDPAALKKVLLAQANAAGEKIAPAELERRYRALLAARELRANLQRLAAAGAQVDYQVCDVRDVAAFEALIDAVYSRYGRIDAVIHGAGVIEDKHIADKTPESFDRVYDTKVDSAWALAHRLRPESLKLLVFFTSVAGRFGNLGQADYGAANETLNRLAWQLHHRWSNTRVLAINWGPWQAGMAGEAIRAALHARGIQAIAIAGGRRWFADELAYGSRNEVELVAGEGPWKREAAEIPATSAAPAQALVRGTPRVGAGGAVLLEQRLDLAELPCPPDQTTDGRPALPLAVARECLVQFTVAAWPEWQVGELRELRAGAPLPFDEQGTCTLLLRARAAAHNEPERQAVTVELLDARSHQSALRAEAVLVPRMSPVTARAANQTR
jgi:acyl transferase domain-containing protein